MYSSMVVRCRITPVRLQVLRVPASTGNQLTNHHQSDDGHHHNHHLQHHPKAEASTDHIAFYLQV